MIFDFGKAFPDKDKHSDVKMTLKTMTELLQKMSPQQVDDPKTIEGVNKLLVKAFYINEHIKKSLLSNVEVIRDTDVKVNSLMGWELKTDPYLPDDLILLECKDRFYLWHYESGRVKEFMKPYNQEPVKHEYGRSSIPERVYEHLLFRNMVLNWYKEHPLPFGLAITL